MDIQSTRWSLAGIRAVLAEAGTGSRAITIGVVDGMPDLSHPVLRDASIDVVQTMIPPDSGGPDAHATGICSVIFGTEDPVRGIAPGCSGLIFPLFFRKMADASL